MFQGVTFTDQAGTTTGEVNVANTLVNLLNPQTNGDIVLGCNGSGVVKPSTTSITDLGSSSKKWKDLHLSGDIVCADVEVQGVIPAITLKDTNNVIGATNQVVAFRDLNGAGVGSVGMAATELQIYNAQTNGDIVFAVNGTGVVKPFTTNITDLGSSSLKFKDLHVSGDVLGNRSYAEIFRKPNTLTTTIVSSATYAKYNVTTINDLTNDFTSDGLGKLTYTGTHTKTFRVVFKLLGLEMASGTDLEVRGTIYKNGALVNRSTSMTFSSDNTGYRGSISGDAIMDLATNDYLEIYFMNFDTNADLVRSWMSFSVNEI